MKRAATTTFRVPAAAWIIAAVVAAHGLFFWAVADKHYLPKSPRVEPENFSAGPPRTYVDPKTGETVTERRFVVSTGGN